MNKENTKYCDSDAAIRDIADERQTLWRLASWQKQQVTPRGDAYGWSEGREKTHPLRMAGKMEGKMDGSVVLQYSIRGSVWFSYNGETHEVPQGHAYIFPSGAELRWKNAEDPEYVASWINMTGAGLREHWELMRDVHGPVIAMDRNGQVMTAFDKVIALHQQQADVTTEAMAIHALVMALYQHCERGQAKKLQPVQRAVQHILRYPFHVHSMKEIAKNHHLSREHLARVFTEEVGQAPARWLRNQRYAHACELLASTEMPIKDVAYQSGFGSVDSLARLLHEEVGLSATAYRRSKNNP